ncbi:unnamed protein product, partial [Musa textilis]
VAAARRFQLAGALPVDVGGAPDLVAAPGGGGGAEVHGHVEAVDEGNVNEVVVFVLVERELGERVGRGAVGLALEQAAAVAGLAAAMAAAVEGAACAGPDAAAFVARAHFVGPALAGVELAAAAGDGGCPDGVGALVDDLEGGRMGEGEEQREEEEGEGGRGGHLLHQRAELFQVCKQCRSV